MTTDLDISHADSVSHYLDHRPKFTVTGGKQELNAGMADRG